MANPFYIRKRRNFMDIANLALQYSAMKERGALTKRGQDIQKEGQVLKEKEFGKLHGTDVVTPSSRMVKTPVIRHMKGSIERREDIDKSRIDVSKRVISLAERKEDARIDIQMDRFNKEMNSSPDRGRLTAMADQYPAIGPMLNRMMGKLDDDTYTTKRQVYGAWKGLKATGQFEIAKADLIKSADAKFKKGDEKGAYRDLALAKAIVKPGFLDDLYNVPESLRAPAKTPTTERLYETVEGWKPRGEAISLKKPETEKTGRLYPTADGYLPAGQAEGKMPPAKTPTPLTDEAKEMHDIKMTMTSQEMETKMRGLKDDKSVFDSIAPYFNNTNKLNKVAYWEKGFWDDETNIITLDKKAIKNGYTPKKIQERALKYGVSVEEILKVAGIIK